MACGCDRFCACFLAAGTGVGLRSGCGAGRCFYYFSAVPAVTKRCCYGLGFDHCVADAAMASFGFSRGLTGSCYCCVFHYLMACGCDRFCACFLAAGTGVGLRSGCGAGRCFYYFSAVPAVTKRCCYGLGFDHCVADAAMASFGFSRGLTSSCYRCVFHCFVACCCNRFYACFLAAGTGVGLRSSCGTGCCLGYFSAVPAVAECCCCGLSFDYCVADAAVASFCFSCCFTGCCYCCVFHYLMTCGCDRFCSCLLAASTGVGLRSSCGTGCCLCYLSSVPAVAKRCCCGLGLEYGSADAAMTSFGFSRGLTGSCYCCVFHYLMACGCDRFCACFLAAGTGVGLRSGYGAGRCFCYFSAIPAVAKRCCCGLGLYYRIADATVTSFCFSGCLTGGCYRCVFHCFVAFLNNSSCSEFL